MFFSLMVGLAATAALGLAMVGSFNLISIAFFVLFVGLGVDFGIQFSVRYRAELSEGGTVREAIIGSGRGMGRALTLAAGALVALRLLWHATEGPERDAYVRVGWGLMVLAFSGPTTYPWYLTWGMFAVAIGSRLRGRLVLLALSVAYALLGGYAGGSIGIVTMVGAFAVMGVVVWRTWHGLVVTPVTERALAGAAAA